MIKGCCSGYVYCSHVILGKAFGKDAASTCWPLCYMGVSENLVYLILGSFTIRILLFSHKRSIPAFVESRILIRMLILLFGVLHWGPLFDETPTCSLSLPFRCACLMLLVFNLDTHMVFAVLAYLFVYLLRCTLIHS